MKKHDGNIYKTARLSAGFTQEQAAEELLLSVESISAYETGQRVPSPSITGEMCAVYDAPLLMWRHMRALSKVAEDIMPPVEDMSFREAVLYLIDSIYAFADRHRDKELISIAKDGVIDAEERPAYDAIMRELAEIVQSAMALRFSSGAYQDKPYPHSVP